MSGISESCLRERESVRVGLTVSTVDGMGVGRGDSLVDDGIKTSKSSAAVGRHAPEGIGRAGEYGRRSGERGDRLHCLLARSGLVIVMVCRSVVRVAKSIRIWSNGLGLSDPARVLEKVLQTQEMSVALSRRQQEEW